MLQLLEKRPEAHEDLEMERYIQAAEQIKEDVMEEFRKINPHIAPNRILKEMPNARTVMDNIEIVIRNAAKHKIFSQRVLNGKKSSLDDADLIAAYLTTSDAESYNDSLLALSCSRRTCYFLFVSRYNNFSLAERAKYIDNLLTQEKICPDKSITLFNIKKELVGMMMEGNPTYFSIQKLVHSYMEALLDLLLAQKKIYQCEYELNRLFIQYLKELLQGEFDKDKIVTSCLKPLIHVFIGLKKRGLDIPPIKGTLKSQSVEDIVEELKGHQQNLQKEVEILSDVMDFLQETLVNIVESNKPKKPEEEISLSKATLSLSEKFSEKFAAWLGL
ncbi:MAG: hypothetical protein AB1656_06860 [Candidatus Omnitrophota bacterium]